MSGFNLIRSVSARILRSAVLFGVAGVFTVWVGGSDAMAADCARTYTKQELSRDIGTLNNALRNQDEAAFRDTGGRMAQQIACVRDDLNTIVFATAYRHIGAYYYMTGDFEQSKRWFKTALELEPTFEYGAGDLAMDHPLRRAFDAQRPAASDAPVALEGRELAVPAGAKLKLDGKRLTEAAATLDRPHLLLVVGEDAQVRQVIVIEGNAIPEQFLQSGAAPVAAATTKKPTNTPNPDDPYAEVKVARVRPPAKTPLMLSGGVLALAGGAIYATSFSTRAKFDAATTTADLDRYRRLTNTLVVSAGATVALGLGVEYVGIIISDEPGLAIRGRF